MTFVLTDVDGSDSGHGQILTTNGHSSTTWHWTVQRSHAVHWYLTQFHCKFIRNEQMCNNLVKLSHMHFFGNFTVTKNLIYLSVTENDNVHAQQSEIPTRFHEYTYQSRGVHYRANNELEMCRTWHYNVRQAHRTCRKSESAEDCTLGRNVLNRRNN